MLVLCFELQKKKKNVSIIVINALIKWTFFYNWLSHTLRFLINHRLELMTGTPLMYVTVIQSEPWILRLVCCLVTFLRGAWRNKLYCCWCCCEHYVSTALLSRPIEYLLPGKSLQCGLLEYDYGRKFWHPFLMWLLLITPLILIFAVWLSLVFQNKV